MRLHRTKIIRLSASGFARVTACCLVLLIAFTAAQAASMQIVELSKTSLGASARTFSGNLQFVNAVRNTVMPYLGKEIWLRYGENRLALVKPPRSMAQEKDK